MPRLSSPSNLLTTCLLTGLVLSLALASARAEDDVPSPGAPDSHQAFLTALRGAETRTFRDYVAVYDAYLERHPEDTGTHLERCLFLENAFLDPEEYVNPYEEEHQECVEGLVERFPGNPEVELYRLERRWGDEAIELGRSLLEEAERRRWRPEHVATIHEVLARQYSYSGSEEERILSHALEAMRLDEGRDLRLLAAQSYIAIGRPDHARDVLGGAVTRLEEPDYWAHAEELRLLVTLGRFADAAALLDRLELPPGGTPDHLLDAEILAGAGRVADARRVLQQASDSVMEWQRPDVMRALFELEIDHGGVDAALASYQSYRDTGISADPFLRNRLRVALRHPSAPWRARDAAGAAGLLGLFGFGALLATLIVVPIHYVGLALAQRGRRPVPPRARWGIRHLWYALFVLFSAEIAFLYATGPDWISEMFFDDSLVATETEDLLPDGIMALGAVVASAVNVIGLALLLRRGDARLFRAPHWSTVQMVAFTIIALLVTRIVSTGTTFLFPDEVRELLGGMASESQPSSLMVIEMCRAIGRVYGLPVLFAFLVVAVPLCEEFVFRGVMLESVTRYLSFRVANFGQAVLFASMHEGLVLFPFYLTMGLATGVLAQRSGGLAAPLLLHSVNNLLVFAAIAHGLL